MSARAQLYLIDGSSQMYRAYHAIRGLTGPDGRSTNAVYGFVTMLRKLLADHQPAYIGAAFDLAAPTFRSVLAADYKANRAPMPPDLAEQVPWVHEACEALGVPMIAHEGVEADDVIATLAKQAVDAGLTVAIVTGDKDFFQLVGERVQVFNPRDDGTWYDAEGVVAKFGVAPSQVVDVLALMGDAIDNVKGVPGIGEKGARDLIVTHGSLDALLATAATLPQRKYREALLTHEAAARQSRELVRLRTDVPVTLDLEALRYGGADRQPCFDLFSRLGFRSLTADFAPTAETVEVRYEMATSRAQLNALVSEIGPRGHVALHVLMDGPSALDARVIGIACCVEPHVVTWVPLRTAAIPARDLFVDLHAQAVADDVIDPATGWALEVVKETLGPVLADAQIGKSAHDLKALVLALERVGLPLAGLADDTMLASYVFDATRSTHTLESLALDELGYKAIDEAGVRGKGAKALEFEALAPAVVSRYAAERADLVAQLAPGLVAGLEREQLGPVYRELELPLVPVLVSLERVGIGLDRDVLADLSIRVDRELARKAERIFQLAGLEFNINSPKQLSEVLFDKLQLPASKKTGKTRTTSTAVEVLEELALVHDLPREILDWRALAKLKGTYIDALPALVRPDTGRLHTSFNQAVAATGRLSSSDPNLQNIPIRTELGREIRRAFVAAPGYMLISADYSQIELRVLAHLSGDESLIDAFSRGEDIHDRTARKVFGDASGLDPYELRRRAKIINYALLYGKTAFTLAKDIGVPQQAAQSFIDAYFDGFPGVRRFIEEILEHARASGLVRTLAGRRRLVPEITSRNGQVRAAAERIAVNMPIQGTAADILKRAMIDLHAALPQQPAGQAQARMILTVHDELLFEVREEHVEPVTALVRHHMEGAQPLAVPLTVDIGAGRNWMEAKK